MRRKMVYPATVRKNDIIIFDTTLRDGEQSDGCGMTPAEKEKVASALVKARVNVIEAGFPTKARGEGDNTWTDYENVQMVSRLCSSPGSPAVAALMLARPSDVEQTLESVAEACMPCIHIFCSTSPVHMEKKLKWSPDKVYRQSVETVAKAVELLNGRGYVEFSPEDATRTEPEFLWKVVEGVIDAGALVINEPDTVGVALPNEVECMIKGTQDNVRNIEQAVLSFHGHNDSGLALANSLTAMEAGCQQIEATALGIGERAGNVGLHEMIFHLVQYKKKYGKVVCFNPSQVGPLSYLVSRVTGIPVSPKEKVIGRRVIKHGAGVHWDGARKDRLTYEIFDPKKFGVVIDSEEFLGPRCGTAGVQTCLEKIGYQGISRPNIENATARVRFYANHIKKVGMETLEAIMECEVLADGSARVVKANYERQNGTVHGTVVLDRFGKIVSQSSEGEGPVEALFNAVDSIMSANVTLEDYQTRSLGAGSGAIAYTEVIVRDNVGGKTVQGKGIDLDTDIAGVKAYVYALNKLQPE